MADSAHASVLAAESNGHTIVVARRRRRKKKATGWDYGDRAKRKKRERDRGNDAFHATTTSTLASPGTAAVDGAATYITTGHTEHDRALLTTTARTHPRSCQSKRTARDHEVVRPAQPRLTRSRHAIDPAADAVTATTAGTSAVAATTVVVRAYLQQYDRSALGNGDGDHVLHESGGLQRSHHQWSESTTWPWAIAATDTIVTPSHTSVDIGSTSDSSLGQSSGPAVLSRFHIHKEACASDESVYDAVAFSDMSSGAEHVHSSCNGTSSQVDIDTCLAIGILGTDTQIDLGDSENLSLPHDAAQRSVSCNRPQPASECSSGPHATLISSPQSYRRTNALVTSVPVSSGSVLVSERLDVLPSALAAIEYEQRMRDAGWCEPVLELPGGRVAALVAASRDALGPVAMMGSSAEGWNDPRSTLYMMNHARGRTATVASPFKFDLVEGKTPSVCVCVCVRVCA